ncbi:MAG TPA: ribosome maturation factor RimM [Rhodanobacteraceae bacterium]|nr:ribosome maturation factor RimM [Rhodanobacteraceae bacterium]
MDAATDGRRVLLGRIVGVYGVRGEVKIESFTEPRLRIFDYQPWLLERNAGVVEEVRDVRGRAQGKGVVAAISGIGDRDRAASLIGANIFVARTALPPAAEGEVYQSDLEGLEVVNLAGVLLGRVSHLFETGANPVLVARHEDGREHLIPYVPEVYVQSVDLEAKRIVVDWDPDF